MSADVSLLFAARFPQGCRALDFAVSVLLEIQPTTDKYASHVQHDHGVEQAYTSIGDSQAFLSGILYTCSCIHLHLLTIYLIRLPFPDMASTDKVYLLCV